MKTLLLALLIGAAMLTSGFAQERTDERKWTIDPETGDTIYTEAVIITESEDITPRSSMIVINPLKFLLFYNISYFYKLNDATAIGGGIQMPTISGLNSFIFREISKLFDPKCHSLPFLYILPATPSIILILWPYFLR